MCGQKLYVNFEKDIAVAWHSYSTHGETGPLNDLL
jgi:hypothetical protein